MRAWELHEQGWKQKDIAAALGISEGAVIKSVQESQDAGSGSLAASAPSRCSAETESRAAGAVASNAGKGCGILRLSRTGLDHRAGGAD
jgi:predicted transcriptional regulator